MPESLAPVIDTFLDECFRRRHINNLELALVKVPATCKPSCVMGLPGCWDSLGDATESRPRALISTYHWDLGV